jgi:hypothetical protein
MDLLLRFGKSYSSYVGSINFDSNLNYLALKDTFLSLLMAEGEGVRFK